MKTKLQALLFVIFSLLNFTTNAQYTELWGMTSSGGDFAAETIFKTDGNGENHNVEESFF